VRGIIGSTQREIAVPLNLEAIQGRYLADLLDQPRALEATWASLQQNNVFESIAQACGAGRFQRVVLTGMGSSYFALHPLSIELAAGGSTPLMVETSELIHYYPHLLTPSTLVVAVSQSGKSVEMVRMLELNSRNATVIGVTNHADSPLGMQANFAVLTDAGEEFSVSCKTYVAALMALQVLAASLCGFDGGQRLDALRGAPLVAETYLNDWRMHAGEFAELLDGTQHLFLVGRGSSLAAARTGALIIKESDHFHAEGMSSAAFRHGPFEMLQSGMFVGVFSGDARTKALNDGLAQDIARTGAKSVSFAVDAVQPACRLPEVSDILRPIVEILPVQMMTLALAALSGREPGKFERATKVTVVQ
jgi:glucosamine--fructose-6-phosphate aminotransferase (isomerizing)